MNYISKLIIATITVLIAAPVNAYETADEWYNHGKQTLKQALENVHNKKHAKNVILFVGDGMGVSTVTAARILEGQRRGEAGEENVMSFEKLPYIGLAKTYNTNQQTPDSAGTMTAMMSGIKTKAGVMGVDQTVIRADCASSLGKSVPTLLEQAEEAGLSTGVVSTARLTHATPAATYAHTPERNWEDDNDTPASEIAAGCKDIASQLIDFNFGNGIEVAMGGGRSSFMPNTETDPETGVHQGERLDGRDLTMEWTEKYPNSAYVWNKAQFDAIDPNTTDHLLGLFNRSHMEYNHDNPQDLGGEPTIAEMTGKAIDILQKNEKGFFLMVESGRIDHAHHAGNAFRALDDTIAFAEAVSIAMDKTNVRDTLIIVTADHSHVFTIAGYPTRGNPILGKVVSNDSSGDSSGIETLADDGFPYATLGYTNGQGFGTSGDMRTIGRQDLTMVDTTLEGFHQEALVPLGSETHAGEDVAIYAGGPSAHLFHNTVEQNYVYHVMRFALKRKLGW
ncbi:MAG: alkaline phosphatase [Nitrosomonas sp.]|nr:MAG: alkaline phosphatase [Nitrosomonas sp.]